MCNIIRKTLFNYQTKFSYNECVNWFWMLFERRNVTLWPFEYEKKWVRFFFWKSIVYAYADDKKCNYNLNTENQKWYLWLKQMPYIKEFLKFYPFVIFLFVSVSFFNFTFKQKCSLVVCSDFVYEMNFIVFFNQKNTETMNSTYILWGIYTWNVYTYRFRASCGN